MNQQPTDSPDAQGAWFFIKSNHSFAWLFGQRGFKLGRFTLILLLWYVAGYAICSQAGLLVLPGDDVGLIEDPVTWSSLAMDLLMVGSLFYSLGRLDALLRRLPGILTVSREAGQDENLRERIARDVAWIRSFVSLRDKNSRRWYAGWMATMVVLVYVLQVHLPLFAPSTPKYWGTSPDFGMGTYLFATLWTTFHFVIVIGNVLWYVLSMGFTVFPVIHRYARKGALVVIPVTPDGKGGMAVVGDFSFSLTLVTSSGMIFCVAWILCMGFNLSMQIGFPLYLLLLAAIFFGPLLSVHGAMRDAKLRDLDWWSTRFREEYFALMADETASAEGSRPDNSTEFRDRMNRLADIDQLYRRVEAMPVWPFNLATLARFFTIVVLPLLAVAARVLATILLPG